MKKASVDGTSDDADRKEKHQVGSVGYEVYKQYFKSVNSIFHLVVTVLFLIGTQAAQSGIDLYVSMW